MTAAISKHSFGICTTQTTITGATVHGLISPNISLMDAAGIMTAGLALLVRDDSKKSVVI